MSTATLAPLLPVFRPSGRYRDHTSLIVAQIVFVLVSASFAWIFWRQEPGVSLVRYLGAAVTMWSALSGAYYFAVNQSHLVQAWFRGLSLTLLAANVFLCLGLMASHSNVLGHSVIIHIVITFNILRDSLGLNYFRTRSRAQYERYRELQSHGVRNWLIYSLCAYAPLLLRRFYPSYPLISKFSPEQVDVFLDGLTLTVLTTELFAVLKYSVARPISSKDEGTLSVEDGYRRWAKSYGLGNGVIAVERKLSRQLLHFNHLNGSKVLDFGCGIGHYTEMLLSANAHVIAVDASDSMLAELDKRISSAGDRIERITGGVSALSGVARNSVDMVIACLVIDHMPDHELQSFVRLCFQVLKPGGHVYITDVNPYFEILNHRYAKFIDEDGIESRIRVQPHLFSEVVAMVLNAGFQGLEIHEGMVDHETAVKWVDLCEMEQFPLIIAYKANKPQT